jgi:hypothetical protein
MERRGVVEVGETFAASSPVPFSTTSTMAETYHGAPSFWPFFGHAGRPLGRKVV